jgi:hypothetical protein
MAKNVRTAYREHANEESDPSPNVICEHGTALLGSDANKAHSCEPRAGLLRLKECTNTLCPDTMLRGLLSGGVKVVVSVVQEAVVSDGLEDKGHIVADCQVVLKITTDQRVQQVRGRCLYNCSHFFIYDCIVIKKNRSGSVRKKWRCVGKKDMLMVSLKQSESGEGGDVE